MGLIPLGRAPGSRRRPGPRGRTLGPPDSHHLTPGSRSPMRDAGRFAPWNGDTCATSSHSPRNATSVARGRACTSRSRRCRSRSSSSRPSSGFQLLTRSTHRVDLTPAGKQYLERARSILAKVDAAREEAQLIRDGRMGRVTIGFTGCSASKPSASSTPPRPAGSRSRARPGRAGLGPEGSRRKSWRVRHHVPVHGRSLK